jgi:hypothetical protein
MEDGGPQHPAAVARVAGDGAGAGQDATTSGDRFAVPAVSVVYRGCAIPVARTILAAGVPHGWRAGRQRTRLTDPAHAARLWLAVAVATRWLVRVGGAVDAASAAGTGAPARRSVAARGGRGAPPKPAGSGCCAVAGSRSWPRCSSRHRSHWAVR